MLGPKIHKMLFESNQINCYKNFLGKLVFKIRSHHGY